jgi:hypothetical protein
MEPNIGKGSRMTLIIIGLLVLVSGIIIQSWWCLFGLIPVIISATGRCLLLNLFKKDSQQKISES